MHCHRRTPTAVYANDKVHAPSPVMMIQPQSIHGAPPILLSSSNQSYYQPFQVNDGPHYYSDPIRVTSNKFPITAERSAGSFPPISIPNKEREDRLVDVNLKLQVRF